MTLTHQPPDGHRSPSDAIAPLPKGSKLNPTKFEHPLLMRPSAKWSRAILWTIVSVSAIGIGWASVAKIEEAIPATGKLEPEGTVKEVQVPVTGVVKGVHIKDGQAVKKGALLLTLDPTITHAQLQSLQSVRAALMQENQFYQAQMQGIDKTPLIQIPAQFLALAKNRVAIVADSQLVRVQLDGRDRSSLNSQQREQIQSNQAELATRTTDARLNGEQLKQQQRQTETRLSSARSTLLMNQQILNNITTLAQSGGISQIQFLKQRQDVETNRAEVKQLEQEIERLKLAIAQAQTKVQSTLAIDRRGLTDKLALNTQRLAEIDSEFGKAIVENKKKIVELEGQIRQAQQTLKYGEVRSPADGIVFDLKANTPGFVANSAEPVLKIVPSDALVAKVSITNQDIGFVREGLAVDVRIDSFPFSEFGDVKGTLSWIGSDALPPTQIQPYYTFPAKVKLERQALQINGRKISLQSGMSINANIKIRKRTVMSIFSDQFSKFVESLNYVR
jgi:HlyD family secretion protein